MYALVAVKSLWGLHTGGRLHADEFRDGIEDTDEPLPFKLAALVMQAGVMALGVLLLAQTDDKSQVLGAVFISAFVGACCAVLHVPDLAEPVALGRADDRRGPGVWDRVLRDLEGG